MSTGEFHVEHKIAHHFDSRDQELQTSKLGMYLFLTTEFFLFSVLFCTYIVFRWWYPEAWALGSSLLDWKLGLLNTLVLITSSFTMALAVRNAQMSNSQAMVKNLLITFVCALIFMVVKYFEYSHKLDVGTLWGGKFFATGFDNPHLHIFFGLYFLMTGLHGLHVIAGMVLIAWLIVRGTKGHFYSKYFVPVELVGLYWHLVDIIWIFLFPLLYLIGVIKF